MSDEKIPDVPIQLTRSSTWLQVETVIGVCITVSAVAVSWSLLNSRVASLEGRVASIEAKYSQIDGKLDQIVAVQALSSQLALWRSGDRWTAAMQEEFQNIWYDLILALHPDTDLVNRRTIPDIRQIQARFPQGGRDTEPLISPYPNKPGP